MGDNDSKWEPLHNAAFEVQLNVPDELKSAGINPCVIKNGVISTLDEGISMSKLNNDRLFKKIETDLKGLTIEFNDSYNENTTYKILESWRKQMTEYYEDTYNSLLSFFTPDENNTDPSIINMRLNKPLNELTDKERNDLRELLLDVFDINEKDLLNWGL